MEEHQTGQWLEYLAYDLKLKEQGLSRASEKRKRFHRIMRRNREDRPRIFSEAHCERIRGKRQVVTKNSKRSGLASLVFFAFFPTMRMVKDWNFGTKAVEFGKLWTVHQ